MRRGCPECHGVLLDPDVLGLRISHGARCSLGMAEDSEAELDSRRGGRFTRAATTTERLILTACGAPAAAVFITTVTVSFLTASLRRREFEGIVVADLPGILTAADGGQP